MRNYINPTLIDDFKKRFFMGISEFIKSKLKGDKLLNFSLLSIDFIFLYFDSKCFSVVNLISFTCYGFDFLETLTIILQSAPYGDEKVYNAFRLSQALVSAAIDMKVNIFFDW